MKIVASGVAFAAVFAACLPARADDPASVMRAFGLMGTWSQDCSDQGMVDAMVLVRFTVSSLGTPRVVIGHPDEIDYTSTIDAAARTETDEVTLSIEGGLEAAPQTVVLKLDSGNLQILPALDQSGHGSTSAILHRCISE